MIAAYQRISRADGDLGKDGKDKSNSIENQKELIQRYISRKESLQNLPVMDFVDDGYTGSNFDRPRFQQMMDGVRSGKIDTIIVKDLSRFGRDYISVGEYMEQIFPLLGVRLIAINDNYDSDNYKGTTLGMQNNFFLKNWNLKNIEKHSRYAKVYFRIRSKNFVMQRIR